MIGGLLVLIIAGAVGALSTFGGDGGDDGEPRPNGPASTTTTFRGPTTTATTPPTSTTTPAPIPRYLAEEKAIQSGSGPQSCGYLSEGSGPLEVADVLYYRGIGVWMTCPFAGGFAWVDYNVPANCSRLLATVGIDDEAPTAARLTMEILDALSQRSLYKVDLGPRDGRQVADPGDGMEGVSTVGVSRVRLQITAPPSRDVRNNFMGVFGDARLLCRV